MTSVLRIEALHAKVPGRDILRGIDLEVKSGEVHAVMGPNGSGKSTLSHVLMGKAGYEVTSGSVTLDGVDLLGLPTWRRAQAGLFLAMQYPIEVPGVRVEEFLAAALDASGKASGDLHATLAEQAGRIGFEEREIECWKHGSAFSLETGQPSSLPATKATPVYAVEIADGDVILVVS